MTNQAPNDPDDRSAPDDLTLDSLFSSEPDEGGGLHRLSPRRRAGLYLGGAALALALPLGAGLVAVTVVNGDTPPASSVARSRAEGSWAGAPSGRAGAPSGAAAAAVPATGPPTGSPATTPTVTPPAPSPSVTPSATVSREPTIERRLVTRTRKVPYREWVVADSELSAGTRRVLTRGVAGVRTLTYEVTMRDGTRTNARLVRRVLTRAPVAQVTVVGTRSTIWRCHPNYAGGCVPIASDVDCAGSGDGPGFVAGAVRVVGRDIYRLDGDGNGYGCD